VEFVKEQLKNPSLSEKDRNSLLQGFATRDMEGIFSAKPLAVDSELGQMALQLAESFNDLERSVGVSLLGNYDDPTSRAKLQHLASGNSDRQVRYEAIQALGNVGDRATLDYLMSYAPPAADQAYLQSALEGSIARLKKKFPE